MREGLALLVNSQHDMQVVAQAADGREACEMARAVKPDVVVLDLSMPGMSGLQAAEVLRRDCPQSRVLALSMHADESYLRELRQLEAAGYVLKQSAGAELLQAIRKVAGGGVCFDRALATRADGDASAKPAAAGGKHRAGLTRKEETVLRLVALGYTNKEIAGRISLSPKTVEAYKCRFARHLGLHGRVEIVRYAEDQGWLADEEAFLSAWLDTELAFISPRKRTGPRGG
jgi:DNA-binding NarL/FixJ family response regulator